MHHSSRWNSWEIDEFSNHWYTIYCLCKTMWLYVSMQTATGDMHFIFINRTDPCLRYLTGNSHIQTHSRVSLFDTLQNIARSVSKLATTSWKCYSLIEFKQRQCGLWHARERACMRAWFFLRVCVRAQLTIQNDRSHFETNHIWLIKSKTGVEVLFWPVQNACRLLEHDKNTLI